MEFDDKEKKALVNSLNQSGAILEVQIFKILGARWEKQIKSHFGNPHTPRPFLKYTGIYEDERRELDCLFFEKPCWYLIEAKQTSYDWYFIEFSDDKLKYVSTPRILFPFVTENGIKMQYFTASPHLITNMGIEIKRNSEGRMSVEKATKNNRLFCEGAFFAERSERGQIIQEACIQIVKTLPWMIEELNKEKKIQKNERIVPMVVTNANLYKVIVESANINERGELIEVQNVESVPFLSYELDWPLKIGSSATGLQLEQPYFVANGNTNLKTILITTIDSMDEAIRLAQS